MKKIHPIVYLLILLLSSCSKADDIAVIASVADFYEYCLTEDNSCANSLNHVGQNIALSGYLNANSLNPLTGFELYDSASLSSRNVSIEVTDDNEAIFDKLFHIVDTTSFLVFTEVKLVGKIESSDMWLANQGCIKIPHVSINNSDNISVY